MDQRGAATRKRVQKRLTRRFITKSLLQNRETLRKHGVKRLGLFGSFARDASRQKSDLDFLVEFDSLSYDKYMDVKIFLEDLFAREVDLVTEKAIKPRLKLRILGEVEYVPGL